MSEAAGFHGRDSASHRSDVPGFSAGDRHEPPFDAYAERLLEIEAEYDRAAAKLEARLAVREA